jgi:DNA-binding transcriptional ArsR family regulator
MLTTSAFAEAAALVGDPARANMLIALMDGRALTAKELAHAAGITAQTASVHLARLTDAGLLAMEKQGRHRYHRLASASVAHMLESIMSVAADRGQTDGPQLKAVRVGPRDKELRRIRTCYDHLAGQLAVRFADTMVERGHIDLSPDGGAVTENGLEFLRTFGVDLEGGRMRPRGGSGHTFCRPCLDWSERRPHIAGAVGSAICQTCFSRGWLRKIDDTRAVAMTQAGQIAFRKAFDLTMDW